MELTDDEIYGRDALNKGEPWIVPDALVVLKDIVKPTWRVFEWGSGGSTVYWSRNCASVISIEHHENWMHRTAGMLEAMECPDNWELQYVPEDVTVDIEHFRDYANAILAVEGNFDLIYIDGEATSRKWCLEHALERVNPGGYLLLDNSNWLEGHDFGPEWERQDFVARGLHWVGIEEPFDWWTSILRKVE